MPDKSPQLTQDLISLMTLLPQKKSYSICGHQLDFFKTFARLLQIYFIFFPINLKIKHLLARIGAAFSVKKLNF